MRAINKFKVGTQFVGNINHAKMEILKIKRSKLMAANGNIYTEAPRAVIKDLKNGKIFSYGLAALERCNVTLL